MLTLEELSNELLRLSFDASILAKTAFDDDEIYDTAMYGSVAGFAGGGVSFLDEITNNGEVNENTTKRIVDAMASAAMENYMCAKLFLHWINHGIGIPENDRLVGMMTVTMQRLFNELTGLLDECETEDELDSVAAHGMGIFDGNIFGSTYTRQLLTSAEPCRNVREWWLSLDRDGFTVERDGQEITLHLV